MGKTCVQWVGQEWDIDIKVLSQVGHPMLPADTLVQFDDVEDMLLSRGVFDRMGVVKRHNKKVCKM